MERVQGCRVQGFRVQGAHGAIHEVGEVRGDAVVELVDCLQGGEGSGVQEIGVRGRVQGREVGGGGAGGGVRGEAMVEHKGLAGWGGEGGQGDGGAGPEVQGGRGAGGQAQRCRGAGPGGQEGRPRGAGGQAQVCRETDTGAGNHFWIIQMAGQRHRHECGWVSGWGSFMVIHCHPHSTSYT